MQDDSTLSRQKKDAESNWKAQVFTFFFVEEIRNLFNLIIGFYDYCFFYGQMLVFLLARKFNPSLPSPSTTESTL